MNIISRIFNKNKRQSYPIGWLAEGKGLEDLRIYLHREWGFGGNFDSFIEKSEVLNWRKLTEDGKQYHLRVYEDGEIRGHLEMSPEKNKISYALGGGKSDAREEFLKFLGDFAVRRKFVSNLVPLLGVYDPDAEVAKE